MVLVLQFRSIIKIFRASCRTCVMVETGDAVARDYRRAVRARVEWNGPFRNYGPNRSIAWKTTPDSRVEHAGMVRFDAHPMRPAGSISG
jgi:uncharacterized membrane protein